MSSFTGCDCNPFGAQRSDCGQDHGACLCKPGVKGHFCDTCVDDDSPVSFDVCGTEGVYTDELSLSLSNLGYLKIILTHLSFDF